jgi:hypothetical protein
MQQSANTMGTQWGIVICVSQLPDQKKKVDAEILVAEIVVVVVVATADNAVAVVALVETRADNVIVVVVNVVVVVSVTKPTLFHKEKNFLESKGK